MDDAVKALSEKLQDDVYLEFSEEELKLARKDFEGTVVLKMYGGRRMKRNLFIPTFKRLWGQKGLVTFSEVEDDILLATFEKEEDKERVLSLGPWIHMGNLVLIARWEAGKQLEELFTDTIKMVIQIHDLPLEMRTEETARRCAEVAGVVLESIKPHHNLAYHIQKKRFFKFKVEVDLKKPLSPGCFLGKKEDKPTLARFRYEKLPNVCFQCGFFNHETTHCQNQQRKSSIPYTGFIRAEDLIGEETPVKEKSTAAEKSKIGDTGAPLVTEKEVLNCAKMKSQEIDEEARTQGSKGQRIEKLLPRLEEGCMELMIGIECGNAFPNLEEGGEPSQPYGPTGLKHKAFNKGKEVMGVFTRKGRNGGPGFGGPGGEATKTGIMGLGKNDPGNVKGVGGRVMKRKSKNKIVYETKFLRAAQEELVGVKGTVGKGKESKAAHGYEIEWMAEAETGDQSRRAQC